MRTKWIGLLGVLFTFVPLQQALAQVLIQQAPPPIILRQQQKSKSLIEMTSETNALRVQRVLVEKQVEARILTAMVQYECMREVLRADVKFDAGRPKGTGGLCYEERWIQLTAPRYQRGTPPETAPEDRPSETPTVPPLPPTTPTPTPTPETPEARSAYELGRLEAEAQFNAMTTLKPKTRPVLKKWEQASIQKKGLAYRKGFMEKWQELGGIVEETEGIAL